jgi:hypothetical protein
MKEYVLWGTPKGQPSWGEDVLFEGKSRQECENAQRNYELKGYDRFRISCVDLSIPPDFKNILKV